MSGLHPPEENLLLVFLECKLKLTDSKVVNVWT